jgi:uncharacterized membrane protein YjgN (DUF898 family)
MHEPIARYPDAASDRIFFTGRRPDFRRLAIRGGMLEFITAGFYRFWLATDIRRHLWSHTEVGKDVPEYTGTAMELLIGFLFALAILAPLYLAYFLIGLEAERTMALASIPLVLFFYFFAQFAIYRARRYRLTRTVWRGVRFWMSGSGWDYAWRAGLWSLLVVVTLGLALPWREAALERFKMRHTSYGDLPGGFHGTGWEFFKRGWWLWLLGGLAVVSQIGGIALPFIYAAFKAIEWRWWVSGIRFGDVRFESDMTRSALIGLYWKVIGWFALFVFVLMVWIVGVFGVAYGFDDFSGDIEQQVLIVLQQPLVLILMAVGYMVVVLALWVVMRIYLMRDMWARVAMTTTVHNLAAADGVAARGHPVSALGEGFADSLDIAGF